MRNILFVLLIALSFGFILEIPVGEKRCVYDEMGVGHKPQLYVNVMDGGKHDIHFSVQSIGRDEILIDRDLGTDPSHPNIYRDSNIEIPYFAEYMFCLDNDKDKFSNHVKIVEMRISGEDEDMSIDQDENDLLKNEDIIHIGDSMEQIKRMTNDIKGTQAAYRSQEEQRRQSVMKTHQRVSTVNIIEIVTFFLFSIIQVFVIRRWFNNKKAILG